jgi:hypothetical protein
MLYYVSLIYEKTYDRKNKADIDHYYNKNSSTPGANMRPVIIGPHARVWGLGYAMLSWDNLITLYMVFAHCTCTNSNITFPLTL